MLAGVVLVLGAYTRLKDAGLGCPDWPGCYGQLIAPAEPKAWIEMIHRYVAGSLGILIFALNIKAWRLSRPLPGIRFLCLGLLGLVIFQALLGMWTVTLGLYPVVVMGHLLGGFAILALLWLLHLTISYNSINLHANKNFTILAYSCFILLILQIALGGWTSANYAALVCADFPSCQGSLWPPMDWRSAFNLGAVGIFDSPGTPLENTARVTIQMFHRIGALLTTVFLSGVSYYLIKNRSSTAHKLGLALITLLGVQILLGITNVLAGLPLAVSLLHHAVAALLLLLMTTILYYLNAKQHIHT